MSQQQIPALATGLAALLLLALTACMPVPPGEPAPAAAPPVEAVAPTNASENKAATGSAFLAANPELLKVNRPRVAEEMNESAVLANNPELMIARRYAATLEARDEPAFLPLPLRRWTCFGERTPGSEGYLLSYSLALNPELSVARRYAATLEARGEPTFPSLPLRRWPCLGQRTR